VSAAGGAGGRTAEISRGQLALVVALETQAICQKTAGKRPKITSNGRLRLAYTCAVVCGCLPRFALPPLPGAGKARLRVVAQTAIFDDLALFATWQAALKWVFGHVSRAPPPF